MLLLRVITVITVRMLAMVGTMRMVVGLVMMMKMRLCR